jgi:hypothetical protein
LAVVSNALEKARAAAREPTLALELDYRKGNELRLPHYAKIRPLREWLAVAALEALHRNDRDAALENIAGISGLVGLQKDDRLLGLQRFRLWTVNIGLQVTWEALQAEGWTEQQLAKLQDIWDAAACVPDFLPSMETDRVTYLQAYDRDTLKDLLDGLNFVSYYNEEVKQGWDYWIDTSLLTAHWLVWRAAWFDQDQLRALRLWQHNFDGTRAVVEQKSWAAWPVMRERRWTFYDRWRYLLYGTSYGCELQIEEAAKYETLREMTVAAIALKRYQLSTGKLPSDLSALVPEFLPALPHDWMDGKPLRYRLNADGTFALYSVGEDGIDNGGDSNPPLSSGQVRMWSGRDEVWPVPATKEDIEAWKLRWLERAGQAMETGRRGRGSQR